MLKYGHTWAFVLSIYFLLSPQNNEGFYQFNPAVVSYTDLRNFSVPLSINRLTNESFFHTESVKVETILGQVSFKISLSIKLQVVVYVHLYVYNSIYLVTVNYFCK